MRGAGGGAAQLSWQPTALYGAGEGDPASTILLPHQPSEHILHVLWALVGRMRAAGVGAWQPRLLCALLKHARAAFAAGLSGAVAELANLQLTEAAMQMQLDLTW